MPLDDIVRMQHIIDEGEEACEYVRSLSFNDFIGDRKTAKAIIRSVEVIGEAAAHISDDMRRKYPEIPWKSIIGMRNRLIHVYFDIDYRTVWQTVKENLPPLIEKIKAISAREKA